ncbi:Hypothetical_protein [Hexamita inflata]|uniref:Hypothetical_protein n=1 Tax=Hexamita inflata TaxID=28002 RepID=A0AA86UHZ6_9EUKA|nr:Hypothetical protein HINF_LOCUS46545 [Hexamita inflata]
MKKWNQERISTLGVYACIYVQIRSINKLWSFNESPGYLVCFYNQDSQYLMQLKRYNITEPILNLGTGWVQIKILQNLRKRKIHRSLNQKHKINLLKLLQFTYIFKTCFSTQMLYK